MGKLIVLEGTDGSGKSTQFRLLTEHLAAQGTKFTKLVFPQYDEPSSALVRMYLSGEFGGSPADVNAYAASTFYAVDRYASFRKVWGAAYAAGELIVSDRYTTSNAVHQTCKEPPERQREFLQWLYDLEFRKMGLPVPDLVLYLDMPLELTEQLMRAREEKTGTHADIHEKDLAYLRACKASAELAAEEYGWTRIDCAHGGQLRAPEAIHADIWACVQACLAAPEGREDL